MSFVLIIQSNLCKTTTLKRPKIGFQIQLLLNAGQKYCRKLQGEHSAIRSTFINMTKLPFVIKIFVLSLFEKSLKTGFTVHNVHSHVICCVNHFRKINVLLIMFQ